MGVVTESEWGRTCERGREFESEMSVKAEHLTIDKGKNLSIDGDPIFQCC